MDLFLGNPTFELSIYNPKDLRLSVFCSVTQEHPFPEGKMYPFLSVPTTLRRTRWMCAISHPTLNCWKLVWWFPRSLAVWLLLMAVFQPVENHCFSEPLLIMWVCCLWRLIIDPVSYKKEAVISPKGQGHHWSLGAGSPMLPYLWGEYMLGAKLAKSWIIAAVAVFILNTKNQTLF